MTHWYSHLIWEPDIWIVPPSGIHSYVELHGQMLEMARKEVQTSWSFQMYRCEVISESSISSFYNMSVFLNILCYKK